MSLVSPPGLHIISINSFFALSTDVDVPHPDEKSIITYVSSLYDVMPRVPDVQDGVKANVSPPLPPRPHQFIFPLDRY